MPKGIAKPAILPLLSMPAYLPAWPLRYLPLIRHIMPRNAGVLSTKNGSNSLPYTLTIPGKFVDLTKLENLLEERFRDNFKVKVGTNY